MTLEAATQRHRTTGRNDNCPCGSEKKYKRCHQPEDDTTINSELQRSADAAEAELKAKLEAEEKAEASEEKSGKSGSSAKDAQPGARTRGGKRSTQGSGRSGGGSKAQSLPRRGAV